MFKKMMLGAVVMSVAAIPAVAGVVTTGTVTETTVDGDAVYIFTSSGTFTSDGGLVIKEALIVGGGGAGGWTIGGGGGGGGIVRILAEDEVIIPPGTECAITVGEGGSNFGDGRKWVNGGDGGQSSLSFVGNSYIALGGGGGAAWDTAVTTSQTGVGSGGGACSCTLNNKAQTTGKGTPGQGHDGGERSGNIPGGGGGYSEAGQKGNVRGGGYAGNGGAGYESYITGERQVYGSGGGGGTGNGSNFYGEGGENAGDGAPKSGGQRGGDAVDGFGGGGGGGSFQNGLNSYNNGCPGGNGGSGTVILRVFAASAKPNGSVTVVPAAESVSASVDVVYLGAGASDCTVSYEYRLDSFSEEYSAPVVAETGVHQGDVVDFTVNALLPDRDYLLRVTVSNDINEVTVIDSSFKTLTLLPVDARFTYSGESETIILGSEAVIKFLTSGTLTVENPLCISQALLVGGGGAGGWTIGGGGGGGGVIALNWPGNITNGEYAVTVGAGGTNYWNASNASGNWKRGGNGGDTSIRIGATDYIAFGGGGGGSWGSGQEAGATGASGGGSVNRNATRAAGVDGQGYNGGKADDGVSGGGDGAGEPGKDGSYGASSGSGIAGDGGNGVKSSITGEELWYGGGGGAGAGKGSGPNHYAQLGMEGAGGAGGGAGGMSSNISAIEQLHGADGFGGGGRGGSYNGTGYPGGMGGSGVIILRLVGGAIHLDLASRSGDALIVKFSRRIIAGAAPITMYYGSEYGGTDPSLWAHSDVIATFAEGENSAFTMTDPLPAGTRFVRFESAGGWSEPVVVSELEEASLKPIVSIASENMDGSTLGLGVSVDSCGAGYDSCDIFVQYGLHPDMLFATAKIASGVQVGLAGCELNGLLPERTYFYQVYARNAGGETSALTGMHSISVPASAVPSDVPASLPCLSNDCRVAYCGGVYIEIEGGILQGGTIPARLFIEVSDDVDFASSITNEVAVNFATDNSYRTVVTGLVQQTRYYFRMMVVETEHGNVVDQLKTGAFTVQQVAYTWRTTVSEGQYENPDSWTVDDGRSVLTAPASDVMLIFPADNAVTVLVSRAESCNIIRFNEYSDVTFRGTSPNASITSLHDTGGASYCRNRSLTLDAMTMTVTGECFLDLGKTLNWSGLKIKLTNGAKFRPAGRCAFSYATPDPLEITVEKGSQLESTGDWISYVNTLLTLDNGSLTGKWILPGLDTKTSSGECLVLKGTNSFISTTGSFGTNTSGNPENKISDIVVASSWPVAAPMIRVGTFDTRYMTYRFSVDRDELDFQSKRRMTVPVLSCANGIDTNRVIFVDSVSPRGEAIFGYTYPEGKGPEDNVNPTGIVLNVHGGSRMLLMQR